MTSSGARSPGGAPVVLDEHGAASLAGTWSFHPGDHALGDLSSRDPVPIEVPGLWEAQGHLGLDGVAWYRRSVVLDDPAGFWTLRFGAVMDLAEVYLNGRLLGSHEGPFTPFEVDPTAALVAGANDLAVRVTDPPVADPDHRLLPHGKQGWADHVFPSPPSLYLTYGGIWQPVTLRRHGPVVVADVFANGDPDGLVVEVELHNRDLAERTARLHVHAAGASAELEARIGAGGSRTVEVDLGASPAGRWSPATPVLHVAHVEARVDGARSDARAVRFGLRRVRVEARRVTIDGEPYRMRSALVQGFRADRLYAEGDRRAIEEEVRAARAMGFNTLRLHVKAFDPTYLDVCDELGMLLHCDVPVAEPIAHEELGADTVLARRCARAAGEQVRRDRNHPSVVLWSAMNEVGVERGEARDWPGYADFVRTVVAEVRAADPTRPVIENDWVEPDPERVHVADVLTAHWYGRLHVGYLDALEAAAARWATLRQPLFVTEFGDWGLPEMPSTADAPFWDTRDGYAAALAAARWPGSLARFVAGTQRYQGLSDRLQAEVFRRHDHLGGYCVTELTDVPAELNGLLDLHRRPKPAAVAEMARANQPVLPMLHLPSLVAVAGDQFGAPVHVANDGPPLSGVVVEARLGESAVAVPVEVLEGWRAACLGHADLIAPEVPGRHDLELTLLAGGRVVGTNRYPIHVVDRPFAPLPVQVLGGARTAEALARVGAHVGGTGPAFVGEGALVGALGSEVSRRLATAETVVVLAQAPDAAAHYPVPVTLPPVETAWGSTVFHFTTDSGALPSLPRRAVLAGEDATVHPTAVVAGVEGAPFPDEVAVIAFKPVPGALTGTVVGAHGVGPGRLVLCQYRLTERACAGDPAALALLADLVRWAAGPRPAMAREREAMPDGRAITYYSFPPGWDR